MGFVISNISNEEDTIVIKPTLFCGLFGHKLTIEKKYLKEGTTIINRVTGKEYKVKFKKGDSICK